MTLRLLVAVLACLAAVAVVRGGVITGRAPITIETPNATTGLFDSFAATELSFSCSSTDSSFSVAISPYYYVATCLPPTYTFTTTAKFAIPKNVAIYKVRTCQVDAAADVNQTTTLYVPTGATNPYMLAQWHRGTQRQLSSVASQDTWSCAFDFTGHGCDAFNGGNGASKQIDFLQALIQSNNQQQRWNNDTLDLFATQKDVNRNVNNTLEIQANILAKQAQQFSILQEEQHVLSKNVDDRFLKAQGDMSYLYNQTAQGLALLSAGTDDKLIIVQNKMVNISQSILAIINALTSQINVNQHTTDNSIRAALAYLRAIEDQIQKGFAGANVYIDAVQLGQVWQALADATSRGLVPLLDPVFPGSAPATTLTTDDLTSYVDFTGILFVNSTGLGGTGTTQIHQYSLKFWSNSAALTHIVPLHTDWPDILSIIGPVNCTFGFSASNTPVENCKAWFEITHTYCTRPVGSTFLWDTMNSTRRADYNLVPSMCQGNVQPTVDPNWNKRLVDKAGDLNALIGQLCNSQSMAGGSGYTITSARVGPIRIATNYSSQVCGMDLYTIFISPDQVLTLPHYLYHSWVTGLETMTTERNLYFATTKGVRPRGLTNEMKPFVVLDNGRSYTCFDTGITTTSAETEIVYSLQPTGSNPRVQVRVYDQAPDCVSVPGLCIPAGNLISSQTLGSVVLQPPAAGILPVSETIIVGELAPSGMASVYDIPQELLSLAPDARSQIGKATYPAFRFASGYSVAASLSNPGVGTLPDWELGHPGNDFDHFASVSAAYWKQPVSQGFVQPRAGYEKKGIATMLDAMAVDTGTDMRQGHLILSPYDWHYDTTFRAVTGPAVLRQQSGCPSIVFDPNDVSGRLLTLSNPWTFAIQVAITRSNLDPHCPDQGDLLVTVLPSVPQKINIQQCGNYTVTVYSIAADLFGTRTVCGTPLSGVLNVESQSNIVLSTLINLTSTAVTSEQSRIIAATSLGVLELMLSVITTAIPLAQLNITAADLTGNGDSALAILIADLRSRAAGIDYTTNQSAVTALTPLFDAFNANQNATSVLLQQQSDSLSSLGLSLARSEAAFVVLSAQTNATAAAYAKTNAAAEAAIEELRNQIAQNLACDAQSWGLSRLTCYFYQSLSTMVTIVLWAAVILLLWKMFQFCRSITPSRSRAPPPPPPSQQQVGGRAHMRAPYPYDRANAAYDWTRVYQR